MAKLSSLQVSSISNIYCKHKINNHFFVLPPDIGRISFKWRLPSMLFNNFVKFFNESSMASLCKKESQKDQNGTRSSTLLFLPQMPAHLLFLLLCIRQSLYKLNCMSVRNQYSTKYLVPNCFHLITRPSCHRTHPADILQKSDMSKINFDKARKINQTITCIFHFLH